MIGSLQRVLKATEPRGIGSTYSRNTNVIAMLIRLMIGRQIASCRETLALAAGRACTGGAARVAPANPSYPTPVLAAANFAVTSRSYPG